MSENAKTKEKKELPVGREYIECDAPGCSRKGPPKRCSRCHRGFYCNVACQRAHWKNGHKEDCFEIDIVRQQCLNIVKSQESEIDEADAKQSAESSKKVPTNTCCFICLSEPMVDPFVLPKCGHGFCFSCLQSWQGFSNTKDFTAGPGKEKTTCPACREEAPDIVKSIHETALLYAARAHNSDLSEDEQMRFSELALDELDKVDTEAAMDPRQKIQQLFTRAEILQQLKRPDEAFQALKEVEAIHKEGKENLNELRRLLDAYQEASDQGRFNDAEAIHAELEENRESNIASLGDAYDLYLFMALCNEEMGDYKKALDIYKFKVYGPMDMNFAFSDSQDNSTPPQQRKMLMGMSKCFYYLKKYELAIEVGESAIEMNRYFPQVHKYVALSQKASGDLSGALRTMGRAVNYETPWDEANRKIVLKMYEEIKKEATEAMVGEETDGMVKTR
mmetsp:Transcript_9897/g.24672  ORF Transcript_9897/g.24672 Transcript_9897/m.24672 type:complete len:448 (+) Transcript_9897:115-1458(+)